MKKRPIAPHQRLVFYFFFLTFAVSHFLFQLSHQFPFPSFRMESFDWTLFLAKFLTQNLKLIILFFLSLPLLTLLTRQKKTYITARSFDFSSQNFFNRIRNLFQKMERFFFGALIIFAYSIPFFLEHMIPQKPLESSFPLWNLSPQLQLTLFLPSYLDESLFNLPLPEGWLLMPKEKTTKNNLSSQKKFITFFFNECYKEPLLQSLLSFTQRGFSKMHFSFSQSLFAFFRSISFKSCSKKEKLSLTLDLSSLNFQTFQFLAFDEKNYLLEPFTFSHFSETLKNWLTSLKEKNQITLAFKKNAWKTQEKFNLYPTLSHHQNPPIFFTSQPKPFYCGEMENKYLCHLPEGSFLIQKKPDETYLSQKLLKKNSLSLLQTFTNWSEGDTLSEICYASQTTKRSFQCYQSPFPPYLLKTFSSYLKNMYDNTSLLSAGLSH